MIDASFVQVGPTVTTLFQGSMTAGTPLIIVPNERLISVEYIG